MRLIDADSINWWKGEDENGNAVYVLDKRDIDKEPTAYDIGKVVEEFEKIRAKETCNKEKCDTKELCRICVVDDAIEIVKQGGVSDDVCEWKQDNMCEKVYRVCGGCFTSVYQKDYKYCPYCGKKIKVVE